MSDILRQAVGATDYMIETLNSPFFSTRPGAVLVTADYGWVTVEVLSGEKSTATVMSTDEALLLYDALSRAVDRAREVLDEG